MNDDLKSIKIPWEMKIIVLKLNEVVLLLKSGLNYFWKFEFEKWTLWKFDLIYN